MVVTDHNVYACNEHWLKELPCCVVAAGEEQKSWEGVATILTHLMTLGADRNWVLVAVGGGMVTDLAGFAASIYMRGIACIYVPTTLLAHVDAAIGGKTAINFGGVKNVVGSWKQPELIIEDFALLQTLPRREWVHGMAEVIKYACIASEALFQELESQDIDYLLNNPAAVERLVRQCSEIKIDIVAEDEQEHGNRKLLNFGHTAAHALEIQLHMAHGSAVALGMVIACRLSEELIGLRGGVTKRITELLERYELPTSAAFDIRGVIELIRSDKKRSGGEINYILLSDIGKPDIVPVSFHVLEQMLLALQKQWI
jgi:3-dehydroquinate synthase